MKIATTDPVSHIKVTQAGLIALLTSIVGTVVSVVPAWKPESQALIQGGTYAISAVFVLANSIHALAGSNVSAQDVKTGALEFVHGEVGKIDFNKLASEAVAAHGLTNISALVSAEVQKVLAGAFSQGPPPISVSSTGLLPPAVPS